MKSSVFRDEFRRAFNCGDLQLATCLPSWYQQPLSGALTPRRYPQIKSSLIKFELLSLRKEMYDAKFSAITLTQNLSNTSTPSASTYANRKLSCNRRALIVEKSTCKDKTISATTLIDFSLFNGRNLCDVAKRFRMEIKFLCPYMLVFNSKVKFLLMPRHDFNLQLPRRDLWTPRHDFISQQEKIRKNFPKLTVLH